MFNPESPPELALSGWLNASEPLSLAQLKGRVVVLVAFQMLCPGCVEHALPQAKRLRARFKPEEVAVIGLHSVFEHHAAMSPEALAVFVSEWKLPFPVAIDQPQDDGIPRTMEAYQMQGTPTLLLFDRAGRLRRHYFGRPDDMLVAAEVMALALEDRTSPRAEAAVFERRLAAALAGDAHDHGDGHAHDEGRPHHGHDHEHGHSHAHGDGCGCDHEHHHGALGHHHHGHAHHDSHTHHDGPAPDRATHTPVPSAETMARLTQAERMTEPPAHLKPKG